jgi:hypothetical protein
MGDEDSDTVSDALPLAQKLNPNAIATVLRAHYSRVYRMAMALCGR